MTSGCSVITTGSAAQTAQVGRLLGAACLGDEVFLLEGDLGAGKTTLTQGLAAGLGVTAPVVSPTFVILREYVGRLPLYHFDFYRLAGTGRAVDLEFDDYLEAGGVCVVEWPDSAPDLAPAAYLRVALSAGPDARRDLVFEALGERHCALLTAVWPLLAEMSAQQPAATAADEAAGQ